MIFNEECFSLTRCNHCRRVFFPDTNQWENIDESLDIDFIFMGMSIMVIFVENLCPDCVIKLRRPEFDRLIQCPICNRVCFNHVLGLWRPEIEEDLLFKALIKKAEYSHCDLCRSQYDDEYDNP